MNINEVLKSDYDLLCKDYKKATKKIEKQEKEIERLNKENEELKLMIKITNVMEYFKGKEFMDKLKESDKE